MKFLNKLLIPIMIIAIFFAFREQNKSNQNIYLTIISIAIFMFGMMKLSSKTPTKNPENQDDDI